MKAHAAAIFLTLLCSVIGQRLARNSNDPAKFVGVLLSSYLECFHVRGKKTVDKNLRTTRITVKGPRYGRRKPLSGVFQRISSQEL